VGSLGELEAASRSLLARRIAPFYEREGGEIRAFESADPVVHGSVGVEVAVTGTAPVLVEGCTFSSLRPAGDNLAAGLEGRPSSCPGASSSTSAGCRRAASWSPARRGTASSPRRTRPGSRFFGLPVAPDELVRQVLPVEQMFTTGGGWQDKVGGLLSGVKYVESRPGLRPHPVVHQLAPFLFQDRESLACLTLF
jgi:hypothetical protein